MDIREIKPSSKDDYESYVFINNVVVPEHPISAEAVYHDDTIWDEDLAHRRLVVTVDGEDVAMALIEHMPEMHDPHRFYFHVMVLPEHRNKGIGGQVYDYVVDMLRREYEANELHTFVAENQIEAIRFLKKRGYEEMMREWESRLDLATFDDAKFGDWREKLRGHGIVIKSWTALVDDPEHEQKLYEAEWRIEQDVPSSHEMTKMDFKTWIAPRKSNNPEFLMDGHFVALHEGEYVGVSSLWVNHGTKNLYVGLTGVVPEYRRKGIALALKTEACLWAKAQGYEQIITWNEENNPMLDLNLKLGFIKQPAEVQFMKRLH